jgi:hypothetical protein
MKLLEGYECIEKHGDYVEKLYNCNVSAIEINYKNCVLILLHLPWKIVISSRLLYSIKYTEEK